MCGAELTSLPEGVQRVARLLQDKGHPHAPQMLDDAARTAQQAASAARPAHRAACCCLVTGVSPCQTTSGRTLTATENPSSASAIMPCRAAVRPQYCAAASRRLGSAVVTLAAARKLARAAFRSAGSPSRS